VGSDECYMTTIDISPPKDMKAFIEDRMAKEGYASASEYFRDLIHEAQRRKAKRELEASWPKACRELPPA
jgi:antitoxin ParD1/3/4